MSEMFPAESSAASGRAEGHPSGGSARAESDLAETPAAAGGEQQSQEVISVEEHRPSEAADRAPAPADVVSGTTVAGVDLSDVDLTLDEVMGDMASTPHGEAASQGADTPVNVFANVLANEPGQVDVQAPLTVLGAAEPGAPELEPARKTRKRPRPGERRMQILQVLAEMLESPQSDRVTTAALAARLEVSEAALYRHFASKAQMFEGLIGFIEQTLFGLINQITSEEDDGFVQLRAIFSLLLTFAERNPGMTRVLIGDALVTEADRLQDRINQLTDRLELSIKQCFRTLIAEGRLPPETDAAAKANLMMACVQGRWLRFAKGGFQRRPTEWLDAQMAILIHD